jgi:hypothetical protein
LSQINQVLFNTAQLATWDDARKYASLLSAGPIVVGLGVSPESTDQAKSGIYVPSWDGGPSGFQEPTYTDPQTGVQYSWLHYRFLNGASGMNVGLIIDKFKRYPNSPAYVLSTLAQEAASLATL